MLTEQTLIEKQQEEKQAMWELFAELMDFAPDFLFTAKEIAKELDYNKSYVSRMLFRLYINKALLMDSKTTNGARLYRLNAAFFSGEQTGETSV